MEKWNLYDHQGILTEKIHVRGKPIPEGFYHLVIHVWLIDEKGRYLIQKRSQSLNFQPGIWAATGGSAIVGESSLDAVIRETREELGINLSPSALNLITRFQRTTHFLDLWRAPITSDLQHYFKPTDEVDAISFKYPEEISEMIRNGSFYSYNSDYFDAVGIFVK